MSNPGPSPTLRRGGFSFWLVTVLFLAGAAVAAWPGVVLHRSLSSTRTHLAQQKVAGLAVSVAGRLDTLVQRGQQSMATKNDLDALVSDYTTALNDISTACATNEQLPGNAPVADREAMLASPPVNRLRHDEAVLKTVLLDLELEKATTLEADPPVDRLSREEQFTLGQYMIRLAGTTGDRENLSLSELLTPQEVSTLHQQLQGALDAYEKDRLRKANKRLCDFLLITGEHLRTKVAMFDRVVAEGDFFTASRLTQQGGTLPALALGLLTPGLEALHEANATQPGSLFEDTGLVLRRTPPFWLGGAGLLVLAALLGFLLLKRPGKP